MSDISDALGATATILDSIATVSPEAIYAHPTETTDLRKIDVFPTVVVSQNVGQNYSWRGWGNSAYRHDWEMLIAVYLEKAKFHVSSQEAVSALSSQDEWIKSMADILRDNMTLSGNAVHIGNDDVIFNYFVGFISWNRETYFGLLFTVPVTQEGTQTINA